MQFITNRFIRSFVILIIIFWFLGKNAACENTYHLVRTVKVDYGREDCHLSRINPDRLHPIVSESFSNDSNGNFYVSDSISNKILKYSKNGSFVNVIRYPDNISPFDMIIDQSNNIYIYDAIQSKVNQINKFGALRQSLAFNPERLSSRGILYISCQKLYIVDSKQRSLEIADLSNGKMKESRHSKRKSAITMGIPAGMDRKYIVSLNRGKEGIINILEKRTQFISFICDGIVSIRFIKEDQHKNFYIQTERIQNNEVVLDIHTFSHDGQLLDSFTIHDNQYPYWTSKLLSIDHAGNIWQFIPNSQFARIHIFHKN